MDFKTYLNTVPAKIEQELDEILNSARKDIAKTNKKLEPLFDQFIRAGKGGKKLRGCLVLLGYELAGGKDYKDVIKAAAAYEIFQTAILAHDDIIDLSPTRRGKPTIYQALGGDHYAISQTICLGDLGIPLATKLILSTKFDPEIKNKVLALFSEMVIKTIYGEMLDVELPHLAEPAVEEDVYTIHKLKTAYYSIIYPLQLGATFAQAPQNQLDLFAEFGEDLGIAFQLQDDILGVFGNEEELGKSVTSDIEEGKNTLLITEALKNADNMQKKLLEKYYGKGKVGDEGLNAVREIFEQTGSLEYSKQKAVEYVSRAKETIPQITGKAEFRKLLEDFSDFMITRSK